MGSFHSLERRRLHSKDGLPEEVLVFCESCLEYFVYKCGALNGSHHLTYNVHSLIHIVQYYGIHGSILSYSAFAFESFLGQLVRLLQGTRKPFAR